ncbi:MAG: helix-turn-helix domain-containing protein [Ruminococcaceae bacterium]|nr:helix-turn-helix domain-containing protein [Oscillospiraceae bacterium]
MMYSDKLIKITNKLCESEDMYSLVLLSAKSLTIILSGYRCFLDGKYIVCLNCEDKLSVHSGHYEAENLSFRPYFYNVNLNHHIIGTDFYTEARERYGYPDFRLFRMRDNDYFGIVPISEEEYNTASLYFDQAKRNIADHVGDGMWSCRTRADVISILRIAEGAYLGKKSGLENEIVRYIYDNIDKEINLDILCSRFNTNRTSLSRLIKEKTGMSPIKFILETRLTQSCPVLLFTEIPVNEISEMHGFSDANYYIRSFKKRFGKTPMQYRNDGVNERKHDKEIFKIHSEKPEMTAKEFCDYYKKGLGRAIIKLKQQEDKTPFKSAFFECMFEENYRVLDFYEKEIIDIFDDKTFKAEIIEKLLRIVKEEFKITQIPLLILMGKRNEVEEIVEGYYKTSYEELLEYTKKAWDGEKYPPCSHVFMSACIILGRYLKAGDKRIKEILFDIADLFEYAEFPVIPTYQNPLFQIWDGVGRKHFFMILDEVVREHKHGAEIDIRNEMVEIHEGEKPEDFLFPKADENFNLADTILANKGWNFDILNLWFEHKDKDKESVMRIARAAIEETDVNRKKYLLSFFNVSHHPNSIPEEFPLDVTPLVQWVEKENYDVSEEPSGITQHVLDILQYKRQDIAREVGLKMFYDKRFSDGKGRFHAIEIRFGVNYKPEEDKEDFIALFHSPNKIDRHAAVVVLERDIRLGVEELPLEMIPHAFEIFLDYQHRQFFCELLLEKGLFPEELKEEFLFDCNKNIRELFLKTPKPKKKTIRFAVGAPKTKN